MVYSLEELKEKVMKREAHEWEVSPGHVERLGDCVHLSAHLLELTLEILKRLRAAGGYEYPQGKEYVLKYRGISSAFRMIDQFPGCR